MEKYIIGIVDDDATDIGSVYISIEKIYQTM